VQRLSSSHVMQMGYTLLALTSVGTSTIDCTGSSSLSPSIQLPGAMLSTGQQLEEDSYPHLEVHGTPGQQSG